LFASVYFDGYKVESQKRRGQLVEPISQISRRRTIHSPQASRRHSPSMASEESHEIPTSEDETFRKSFYDMTEMVKVLFEERNSRLQGEISNPPRGNEDSGDKNPKGNGGNDDTPPH
jgi:hypothetical protein